jgi:hypothetical protein
MDRGRGASFHVRMQGEETARNLRRAAGGEDAAAGGKDAVAGGCPSSLILLFFRKY